MFMQNTLTQNPKRSNKRKNGRKKSVKKFRSVNGNGSKGSITGGHNPHYGTRKTNKAKNKIKLPTFTPWKVILTSFLIGACGLLYINHVFSTQQTLQEVQQLEAEFNKVQRIHAEKRLVYDRMIGPKEIYQNARDQGFINAGPADRILILKK